MRIGFTGTQEGMTNDQLIQVHMLLGDLQAAGATHAIHGMCIGADAQFHEQAKGFKYVTVGYPGVTAFGEMKHRSACKPDEVVPAKPFLIRNRDIVRESDVMIATPKEAREQALGLLSIRSGTWATIRYARSAHKPLLIVWPDGSGTAENVPGASTVDAYRNSLTSHTCL